MRRSVFWLPFSVLPAVLVLTSSPLCAAPRIIQEKGKVGVVDSATGEVLIRPHFEALRPAGPDVYIAQLHGRWGLVDISGATLADFRYDSIRQAGDHCIVSLKYEKTVVNTEYRGSQKKVEYDSFRRRIEVTNVPVVRETKQTFKEFARGVIGRDGEILIPIQYDVVEPTSVPGVFRVGQGDEEKKYGVVNVANDIIVPVTYEEVMSVARGRGSTIVVKVRSGYKEEELVIETGSAARAGPAGAAKPVRFKEGGRYGFRAGDREIVPPIYEDAWDFKNGFARVKRNGKWGFVDGSGKVVVEPGFDYVWDFDGNRAKVRLEGGDIRYVDATGKILSE